MIRRASKTLSLVASLAVVAGCNNSPAAQSSDGAESAAAPPAESAGARVLETTFDDIKFEMQSNDQFVDEMITSEIAERFDRRIRLRGYMFPTLRETGLKQFVLVRDNQQCCFGPGPALYDCVLVYMRDGATAEFSMFPVTVEGEFRFEKLSAAQDGPPLAIYRMDDSVVR